ncbi:hypothetical protein GW17_00037397, partial [Ensete ventricosum]
MCGQFGIPFWKFFLATLTGKAIIKAHIQVISEALESVVQFDMEYRDMAYALKLLCKDSSCYRTKISQETARLGTDKSQANDYYLI